MKITKNLTKTKQLIKYYVIKNRTYENLFSNSTSSIATVDNVSEIVLKLKKIVQIIFSFHKKKKKILFIGLPEKMEIEINSKTNHSAIPKFFNVCGLFLNNSIFNSALFIKQHLPKKGKQSPFSELSHKPDLIVIFESNHENSIILESYQAKIPVILLNAKFYSNPKRKFELYRVPGNFVFNKNFANNLFLKVINSAIFSQYA